MMRFILGLVFTVSKFVFLKLFCVFTDLSASFLGGIVDVVAFSLRGVLMFD